VDLFLPTYDNTRLSFIRALLGGDKKALKAPQVHKLNLPHYSEISVKNLYDDAMKDSEIS
jgi:hypothetical protein